MSRRRQSPRPVPAPPLTPAEWRAVKTLVTQRQVEVEDEAEHDFLRNLLVKIAYRLR